MAFLRSLWALTRFEHAVMLAIAVLIGETIVLGSFPPFTLPILLSLLVPMLSEAGSFALNDYLDIETDKLNKKTERPLVAGTLAPKFALWFSISCIAFSVLLAFFINLPAFLITLAFNILAIIYNWKMKDLPLAGNAYIGLTMAIPFLFGNYVVSGALSPLAVILASLGFVAGLAREIVKSVQDMEGDRLARGSKTLPLVIGANSSVILATLLYLAFIALSALPFLYGLAASVPAIALVAIADLGIFYNIYLISAKKDYKKARNYSLIFLFIGLVGLLLAAL